MSLIKGKLAYWKQILYKVLVMLKELGFAMFFLALTLVHHRRNELMRIISKLKKRQDDIDKPSCHERCFLLDLQFWWIFSMFLYTKLQVLWYKMKLWKNYFLVNLFFGIFSLNYNVTLVLLTRCFQLWVEASLKIIFWMTIYILFKYILYYLSRVSSWG